MRIELPPPRPKKKLKKELWRKPENLQLPK
jgi:hypothetical protein